MTAAELSPQEAARVAAFDAAPTPPEVTEAAVVEQVARAIFLDNAEEGGYLDTAAPAWDVTDVGQAKYRRLAAAAVTAYRATQDGEA